MQRLILAMAERDGIETCAFEFVMVAGHFLARDENIFTFFEGVEVKPPEQSGQQIALASCVSASSDCHSVLTDLDCALYGACRLLLIPSKYQFVSDYCFYSHRNRRMQMPCNMQWNRESVADWLSLSVTVYC